MLLQIARGARHGRFVATLADYSIHHPQDPTCGFLVRYRWGFCAYRVDFPAPIVRLT